MHHLPTCLHPSAAIENYDLNSQQYQYKYKYQYLHDGTGNLDGLDVGNTP
jgi:hypothetical protein